MDTGGLHTLTTPHRQSLGVQYDRARVDMRKEYQPVLFALNKKKESEKDVINLGMSRLGFGFFFPLFHCFFSFPQARMERDMSARKIYGEEETPEGAAGSEFGKKQREEARRKKFGIVTREFKVEDQPWILKVNGKAGKR